MYIMCVILCLFSALSRRVGALQISIIIIILIIIIIIIICTNTNVCGAKSQRNIIKQLKCLTEP